MAKVESEYGAKLTSNYFKDFFYGFRETGSLSKELTGYRIFGGGGGIYGRDLGHLDQIKRIKHVENVYF